MKVAIYTYDLCPGREYLMPWRTILEVAKVMTREGHEPIVLNACYDESIRNDYEWQGVKIRALSVGFDMLATELIKEVADVAFLPFAWRDGLKDLSILTQVNCRKIAYMAGGIYDLLSAWTLLKAGGKMLAKPYVIENLVPKKKFVKAIRDAGFDHVIGLTDLTARTARNAGFISSVTIYPGKDSFEELEPDESLLVKYDLKGKKWLLFSGAPIAYRGASTLLKAVDGARDENVRVVFLMRKDAGRQFLQFFEDIDKVKHKERFIIIQERCTREQLRAIFGSAWYALLPFIVIPSEIPLTYFELLSCGTPVITFKNGGTTEYLKDGLLIAEKSVKGLTRALDRAWGDETLRFELSENGKRIIANHPTWEQIGYEWIKLLKK